MHKNRQGKPNKVQIDYTLKDAYSKTYEGDLSWSMFKKVWCLLMKYAIDRMIFNADTLHTYPAGAICILKQKINFSKGKFKVDWAATYKLWERDEEAKKEKRLLHFMNNHTDNYFVKFNWQKKWVKLANKTAYRFSVNRPFPKQYIAEIMLNNPEDVNVFEI